MNPNLTAHLPQKYGIVTRSELVTEAKKYLVDNPISIKVVGYSRMNPKATPNYIPLAMHLARVFKHQQVSLPEAVSFVKGFIKLGV